MEECDLGKFQNMLNKQELIFKVFVYADEVELRIFEDNDFSSINFSLDGSFKSII